MNRQDQPQKPESREPVARIVDEAEDPSLHPVTRRNLKKTQKKLAVMRLVMIGLISAILIVGILLAVLPLFHVSEIVVEGNKTRSAEEIIAARALTGLSSDILASELGISRRLLDQRFRQITGRSVRDSVEALRLDNVKRLLKGSVLTHQEIAASSGFSSAVYLETVFVKRFGMTMSSYRASGK